MHDHEHSHDHHDHHSHEQHIDPVHLLEHMYEHNTSHTNELKQVAGTLEGEARDLVLKAAASFEAGNDDLFNAIKSMKEA